MERWKDISGLEGFYQVSDLGHVRRLGRGRNSGKIGKILKPMLQKGITMVDLYKSTVRFHLSVGYLVLTTFVGPRPTGKIVRHLNDNPLDNRLQNLSWGTYSQNALDRWAINCSYRLSHSIAQKRRWQKNGAT